MNWNYFTTYNKKFKFEERSLILYYCGYITKEEPYMVNNHNVSDGGTINAPDEEDYFPNVEDNLPGVEDDLNYSAPGIYASASDMIKHIDNFVYKFVATINEFSKEFYNYYMSLEIDGR